MLPACNRLTTQRDFELVTRRGRRSAGELLVMYWSGPGNVRGPARVGVVVGRSVGPAVTRNLVKRRLRHLARTRLDALLEGSTLVIRALPAAARGSFDALGADLGRALDRLARQRDGAA